MKRLLTTLGLALAILFALLAVRAGLTTAPTPPVAASEGPAVDAVAAAQRLAIAVTYATVSRQQGDSDPAALAGLHRYLADAFPRVHTQLSRELVGGHSLLYSWPGAAADLPPILLLGHLDVVPVQAGTEGQWTQPPFAGVIANGYIWGRGTLDDKVNVLGVLEAVEILLADGFRPARTVLLAFGHDEEVGGRQGAAAIAAQLARRGVAPALVLDEGSAVIEGMVPGLTRPAALIGIAEKGFVNLELEARAAGGHASMPPRETAVGILARALRRLEARPMPARIAGPVDAFLDALTPELPFGQRLVMANRWLFAPLVRHLFAGAPGANASLRTTLAPTMVEGGVKPNVLPVSVRAVINARVHPNDTIAGVEAHLTRAIDDPRVTVRRRGDFADEPSPVSPIDTWGYRLLARTAAETFPGAVVAPGLVIAGTDAKHYVGLTDAVYRFTPMRLTAEDAQRIHGTDERIAVEGYATAVAFYARLIRNAMAGDGG